ncbi:MAG TPA: hypothetical protein VLJ86_06190 [Ramlibacter sp.]|nr:hypothetical protein [Ramlibacter sp.]
MPVNAPYSAPTSAPDMYAALAQKPGAKLVLDSSGQVQMVLPKAPGLRRLQAWLTNNYDADDLARLGQQSSETRMKSRFQVKSAKGVQKYELKPGSAPGVLARHRNRLANEGVADAVLKYITFKDFSTLVAVRAKASWKQRVVTLPPKLFAHEVALLLRGLNNAELVVRSDQSTRMLIREQLTDCANKGQLLPKEPIGRIEELALRLYTQAKLDRDAARLDMSKTNSPTISLPTTLGDIRPHVLAAIEHFRKHADVTRYGEAYPAVVFDDASGKAASAAGHLT